MYSSPPSAGTSLRSMPVQNALSPAAVTITARTASSSRTCVHVAAISSHIGVVKAL